MLPGPPEDNLQDFWNTWYAASQIRGPGDLFYTDLIKFPEGTALYYHSFAYPKILIAAFFGAAFGASLTPLVILQNLFVLMSFPIAAIGAFYLIRHFTREDVGALAGGAVFAFNPSHVEHALHHLHVSSIEFIPFFVLFFILVNQQKSLIMLGLSVACYVLSALSCWYYLFYCLYFMLFYYIFHACRQRAWPGAWAAVAIVAHLAIFALIASPLLRPMIAAALSGADVYQGGSGTFVADLAGYVAFPQLHPLGSLTAGIREEMTGNEWEATVYLGLVNLALLAWLATRRRPDGRGLGAFLIAGMLLFAALASGDWLHLLGKSRLPMPDMLLGQLPFFRNVRTPSRAIVFVYLFLAIGVGAAIAQIRGAWPGRWRGKAVAACLLLLMAIDWYPVGLPATPFACSPAYRIVAADADPQSAVLDLPLGYLENNAAMAHQICHRHPIVGGVVSREPTRTLRDRVIMKNLSAQRRQLADSGVGYVVIHRQDGDLFAWPAELGPVEAYLSAYPVLYSGPDAILLRTK
jgi:hypothetical protein